MTSEIISEVGAPSSTSSTDLEGEDARARGPDDQPDDFLDWFERTYPTFHHGAKHTVKPTRDGPIVRELLDRGYRIADLQAMATLLWSINADTASDVDRRWIVDKVTVRGIPLLRHKADYLDGEVTRAKRATNVWAQILQQIESQVDRHTFHTWFRPLVMVTDTGSLIEVTKQGPDSGRVADWIRKHHYDVVCAAVEAVRPGARVEFIDVWTMESQVG